MVVRTLVILAALGVAPSVFAQTPAAGGPVSQAIRESWDSAKKNITESAAQMPEDGYAFKPVATVRTFGQILAHIAGANYEFCSGARGEKSPHAEDEFEKSATTKADIIKALDASLAYCDAPIAALTDKTAAEVIDLPFGMPRGARAKVLLLNTGHLNEHYGNLVTYFRVKGMVPPSSRGQ
jgi:uncharacterized damage-inducible protein DinB